MRGLHRFRPHEKLRSSPEYQRVKATGRRVGTRHFTINFVINGHDHHRLGLVVQKRFWSAVGRNRIKRCLREWFRMNRDSIPLPGKDIVIVARPGSERLSPQEMTKEILVVFLEQDGRSS
ncbi:MAG: ribonuclease P protein component [Syntrophobacteraceae bacterium]|nr:ribonuclease P protein component [Syntrophobacteraceae bacterium]